MSEAATSVAREPPPAVKPLPSGAAAAATAGGGPDAQLWAAFAGAEDASEVLRAWLALQCAELPSARAATLLLIRSDGSFGPAAVWPDRLTDVTHLAAVAERALTERIGVAQAAPGAASPGGGRLHIAYPIESRGEVHGAIVVDAAARPGADLQHILRRLHWGAGWIEGFVWRNRNDEARTRLEAAALALEMLAVVEEHATFDGAGIALANELAQRLRCDRVAIGMAGRGRVRLRTLSHAAWFQKRADIVGALENAQEEAFDQMASVTLPPLDATEHRIAIAHAELARHWGASAIASVLMRARAETVGIVTFERVAGEPFDETTLEMMELIASLAGPVLKMKADARRWISGRWSEAFRSGLLAVFGPRHPAAKLACLLAAAALAGLAFATGEFRVSAKSVLEGSVQRAAVAPFQGFIQQAPAKAGDVVGEGQLLAALDDRDLRSDALKWESERQKNIQRERDALAKHDRAGLLVAAAQLTQAEAELALATEKLSRARIVAPIRGLVVSGDLSQTIGSPVEQGKVLFEIAPLDSYRVVIQVSEYDMRHVRVGQRGTLSLTGSAGATVPVEVERITPVSTPQNGRNYFRVEALMGASGLPLRPGMEGIAKLEAGTAPLLWIWTRTLVERLKVLLWEWTP